MLQAVLHGKAGRIEVDGRSQSWRDLFRQFEDLLTAVFVGRFHYLSDQGLKDVLHILLNDVDIDALGRFVSIDYWSKLDGVEDRSYVEPDIVIRFSRATLLIEVKRPDGIQYLQQWSNEVAALSAQDDIDTSDNLIFLALGGLGSNWEEDAETLQGLFCDINLKICAKDWDDVNDAVRTLSERNEEPRDAQIYADWLTAFQLFGLRTKVQPYIELMKLRISNDWRGLLSLWLSAQDPSPAVVNSSTRWNPLLVFKRIDSGMLLTWK